MIGWMMVFLQIGEVHLSHIRALTQVGDNAEAYFSFSGDRVVFQSVREPFACDQIFLIEDLENPSPRLISTGRGRTTCSYFLPGDSLVIYASTHETHGDTCLPGGRYDPELQAYVWPLYDYDLYVTHIRTGETRLFWRSPGYDAEATVGPDGRVVFTSTFEGDMEIYILDPPYTGPPRRITHTPGYDGGAFFTRDGRYLVYRGWHPRDSAQMAEYRELLDRGLMKGVPLQIFVYDLERDTFWQVTDNGAVNFAPFPFPDRPRIIFASNYQTGRAFHLWAVDFDGKNLERITYEGTFNSFPMFSPDGRYLIWASNRGSKDPRLANILIATWVNKEEIHGGRFHEERQP